MRNVDAIATTPGVNALMLGSGDMRVSLGLPARTPPGEDEDPRFHAALAELMAAGRKHRKPLMCVAFKTSGNDWLRNFSLLLTSADIVSTVRGHKDDLARMKGMLCGGTEEKSGRRDSGSALRTPMQTPSPKDIAVHTTEEEVMHDDP